MFELKPISHEAIPEALRKVERYRLLNEPMLAQSICEDILRIEPTHQEALMAMILSITDQFGKGGTLAEAKSLLSRIGDEYERCYHRGIIFERWGNMWLRDAHHGANFNAYDAFREAMHWYEKAEELRPAGNDEAVLRWNTCVRLLTRNPELRPRPQETYEPVSGGDF